MGGLGCPASLALARAGVDEITIADPDFVGASNLHRQPWYRTSDVGAPKVALAAARLRAAFPGITVNALACRIGRDEMRSFLPDHAVVIDGTDDVETKFLLSDAAVQHRTPLVYGGVLRMQGQAMLIAPGGPCLRCLFEPADLGDEVPSCARAGVLGSVAGVVGAIQALLALGALRGEWQHAGRIFLLDGWTLSQRRLAIGRAADCPACASQPGATRRHDAVARWL
jgi:adenylyltransferase/sulfurtransferase